MYNANYDRVATKNCKYAQNQEVNNAQEKKAYSMEQKKLKFIKS